MSFAVLGEDILLKILGLCDVYTVLVVAATNKPLRRVTLTKQLWLSLIQDTTFRDVLDLAPPNLEELESNTTEELIDLVKRYAIGPSPWWMGISSSRRLNYTITLPNDVDFDNVGLLPGARYAVFQWYSRGSLYIYDVWSGLPVFIRAAPDGTHWEIDLVSGGVMARIFSAVPIFPSGHQITIDDVDLTSGVPREVFRLDFLTRFGSLAGFVGGFFLYTLPLWTISDAEARFVLVNWRTSTYVVLNYGTTVTSRPILIPGYIVTTYLEDAGPQFPPRSLVLTVTALDSFSPYWKSLTEISLDPENQVACDGIPAAVFQRLEYDNQPLGDPDVNVAVSAHASALYRGAFTIVVYAGEMQIRPPKRPWTLMAQMGRLVHSVTGRGRWNPEPEAVGAHLALLSFKFTPPPTPGQPCRLRLVSAERAAPRCNLMPLLTPRAVINRKGGSYVVSCCYP